MENCRKCGSHRVCFVQKQIEGLAERMTQQPFIRQIDVSAERSMRSQERHEKMIEKRYDLECSLKAVIATHCSFFKEVT